MKTSDLSAEELNELLHTVSLDTCPKLESAEIYEDQMNKYEAIVKSIELIANALVSNNGFYGNTLTLQLSKLVDELIRLKEPE